MRSRKSSSSISVRATPTTEKPAGSRRRRARFSIAGMSLRLVRSPDAPNTTSTAGGATRSDVGSTSGLSPAPAPGVSATGLLRPRRLRRGDATAAGLLLGGHLGAGRLLEELVAPE